jgi:cupin 2 domain-containing protein
LPDDKTAEQFHDLLKRPGLRIERIVSNGQSSPPGFWYDQPHGEWVLVLRGEARLAFDGDAEPVILKSGEFIDIAPHRRHRVEWTHPSEPTVWLAIHYNEA